MTKTIAIKMPRLGESVSEGTIVRWHVQPGATVNALDALLEVDTDKVSTDIPSPTAGVVRSLLAKEGDSVPVGADIAVIEIDEAETATPLLPTRPAEARTRGGAPTDARTHAPVPPTRDAVAHAYSPAVRKLARENDLDLSLLTGTGEGGRVTRKDVLAAVDAKRKTNARPAPSELSSAVGVSTDERVPLTRLRQLIATNMTASKATIPHAWQAQEVDMRGVVANRALNKAAFEDREGFSLTFLPYVVAATVAALRQHPLVNATFGGDHLVIHRNINIGIAIGLEAGVLVPVIRSADEMNMAGLARAINDLATRARTQRLTADDLTGGTFTVNNSGTFGTVVSYSVIAPGQAGILTMGAIKERVVAVEGSIAIRPMMFLCFSLDHRVLDGLEAARFLSTCRERLQRVDAGTPIY